MTDELPEIFDRLKPQPAPTELRPRVLSAVERELARRRKPRWERAFELGVAACLALGVGLNVVQWRSDAKRPAGAHGPPSAAAREEFVDAVASIMDEATAKTLVDGLVSMRSRPVRAVADDVNGSLKN
jgi:hypothetical protein